MFMIHTGDESKNSPALFYVIEGVKNRENIASCALITLKFINYKL